MVDSCFNYEKQLEGEGWWLSKRTVGGYKMKIDTVRKIEIVCLIAILIGICIIIFIELKPSQKKDFVLNYGKDIDKQTLIKKKIDLQYRISELQMRLFYLKQSFEIVEMDLESIDSGMNFKYIQIPDSGYVMRVEYNGSSFDDIEIQEAIKQVEVKRRWTPSLLLFVVAIIYKSL